MFGFFYQRITTLFWTTFYGSLGRVEFARLGKGVRFEGRLHIPQRGGRIIIGDGVVICRLVEFSVPTSGELEIENGAFIGRGVNISAHNRVKIGADTLVAEFVSIHDNDHKFDDPRVSICRQGFRSEPLEIGPNCWIGAKAVLLRRSGLGERCVLGAGAVLTKRLPPGTKAAGVPAVPLQSKMSCVSEKDNIV